MLTLFTVKMKWHYNDEPSIAKFCAVAQEEADFLSCFLICWGEDLKMLYNGCYVDENYPCHDIVRYKLKMLVTALNGLFPHDSRCIFEKINDYDVVQIAVRALEDLTGWKFNNKDNCSASIVNYTTEDLSNCYILSMEEIEELIRKKYPKNLYVDEGGLVGAAVERERKRLLTQAKEQTNG